MVTELEEPVLDTKIQSRLSKDIREAARHLGIKEYRYIVSRYYQTQEDRKRSGNQDRDLVKDAAPNAVVAYFAGCDALIEKQLKGVLNIATKEWAVSRWMRSHNGVAEVLAAAFTFMLDIRRAPTVGHFESYCGLNTQCQWLSREDAKAVIKRCLAEGQDVSPMQVATEFYGNADRGVPREASPEDVEAVKTLFRTFGQRCVQSVLPTIARRDRRMHTPRKLTEAALTFADDLRYFQQVREARGIADGAIDWSGEDPVPFWLIRKAAYAVGRNPFNIERLAKFNKDTREFDLPITMDSLEKALSRRPWNALMKSICWRLGDCFMKLRSNPNDFYGQFYDLCRTKEEQMNEEGKFKQLAEHTLATKKLGKTTEAYKWYTLGKLPPGRLHLRAQRVPVKLFLSHAHHVMFVDYYGREPPRPYVFEHLNLHSHFIAPPHFPWTGGGRPLRELLDGGRAVTPTAPSPNGNGAAHRHS